VPQNPPPGPPRDRPTEDIPQYSKGARSSEPDTRMVGGAAAAGGAGAAGAAAAGAAGAAAAGSGAVGASGAPGSPREPQLLTHESAQGGYNYYGNDDDPYGDDGYDDYGDDGYDDGYRDDYDDSIDPDDELSAARARKKTIWRRVRRTCYVAVALMFLGPVAAVAVAYPFLEVKDPAEVAKATSQTIVIKYNNGQELTRIVPDNGENRTLIKNLDEVSQPMQHATLAAEDATFYQNPGFDVMGILRAVWKQATGQAGGGSTLTQQYIKLSTQNDEYSYVRKFNELVLAFKMSNQQSKEDILKAYLNTAYYGRGAYGIHAAADAYFNKLPKDLTPGEAAVLGGMVQQPTANDPRVDKDQATARWNYVIGEMVKHNWASKEEKQASIPETQDRFAWRGGQLTGSQFHIRERVLEELDREGYKENTLAKSGHTIVTNIDPGAQQMAEAAVDKVTGNQPQNLKTSLVAVNPMNGGVQAYYGGGSKVGGFDYANAPQEPGSSFKPFVALAALEQNHGIGENYDGNSPRVIAGTKIENARGVKCAVPNQCGVREAMTESVNTVFFDMASRYGPTRVQDAAYEAGIPKQINGKPTLRNPDGGVDAGIGLGQYPVRTIDMASAYGTFANSGQRVPARFVNRIEDGNGELVKGFQPRPEPAFAPIKERDHKNADDSKNLAANVIETMLEVAKRSKLPLDRPVASKTGTHQYFSTDKNAKAWMVGFTPQISTAVSMSADDNGKVRPVEDSDGKAVYGSGLPGKIWQEFMANYLKGKEVIPFPKAKPIGQYEQVAPTFAPPPPPTSSAPPSSSSVPAPTSSAPSSEPSETSSSKPWNWPTKSTTPDDCGGLFPPPECQ
jgi:membrane peptidoglycan carboxypeptidase